MGRRRLSDFQRHNILLLYVRGYPYREIARQALVSISTVSNVLADLRADDNWLPLSRMLAIELQKNGQDMADCAVSNRTRNYLKRRGIDEHIGQNIATEIVEICFKMHIPVEQFVKDVEAFIEFSKKYARDNPRQAVKYANSLKSYIESLKDVIKTQEKIRAEMITQCKNAEMNFQFLMKEPGIKNVLLHKDMQIADIRRQRDELQKENNDLRRKLEEKTNKPYEFKITTPNQKIIKLFPGALEKLNTKLAIPIGEEDIFSKLDDIAFRPHEYSDLFIRELAVNENLQLESNSNPPERSTEAEKSLLK
jgi:hypothetical protein